MGKVIGDILPYAIGVAISPLPIVAVILILGTPQARSNGPIFLVGCIAGTVIAGTFVLVVADAIRISKGDPSTAANAFKLLLGVLLLFGAFRSWRKRPRPGDKSKMPKWMEEIDRFTWPKSLGFGMAVTGLNPKNLVLIVAAATAIAQSGIAVAQQAGAFAVFVVIGVLGITCPLVVYFTMQTRAARILDDWKTWLTANNATVMTVLFLVFAAVLIGRGIMGLT